MLKCGRNLAVRLCYNTRPKPPSAHGHPMESPLTFKAITHSTLPTEFGVFDITVFDDGEHEHVALSTGLHQLDDQPVLVRVHSECLTGDAFGSMRCDCGPQLSAAMAMIQSEGRGAILYLRQEGRGIGLSNKIRAYALQDQGHDTLEANLLLGFAGDERTYEMCQVMLDTLGIKRVRLLTNNPAKINSLSELGIEVTERVPLQVGENPFNMVYLQTKRSKMGHLS